MLRTWKSMSKFVEPSDQQNEESHEQLMRAFKEYFSLNQAWHAKGTRVASERLRKCLMDIRKLAKERRVHVQQYRTWLDRDKPKYIKARQKAQGDPPADTN